MLTAGRAQILSFRVASHHLDGRLPPGSMIDAAATCGVRTTPGDAARLGLQARLESFTSDELGRALEDRSLVEVLSARGNAAIVPARDVAAFTIGTLPRDEQSLRDALRPAAYVLEGAGLSAGDALRLACDAASDALAAGAGTWSELSGALTRRLPELSPMCRGRCGVAHIDDAIFRLVAVAGVWCFRPGSDQSVVRIEEWLGTKPAADGARAELVRRFLHAHGPATASELAAWTGISVADARRSLEEQASELREVGVGKRRAWMLAADAGALGSPGRPVGGRLLGPTDPYLGSRDRETLVPDPDARKRLWRAQAAPGAALVGAEIVATWRTKRSGKLLTFVIEPMSELGKRGLEALHDEAERVGALRGCAAIRLQVAS